MSVNKLLEKLKTFELFLAITQVKLLEESRIKLLDKFQLEPFLEASSEEIYKNILRGILKRNSSWTLIDI